MSPFFHTMQSLKNIGKLHPRPYTTPQHRCIASNDETHTATHQPHTNSHNTNQLILWNILILTGGGERLDDDVMLVKHFHFLLLLTSSFSPFAYDTVSIETKEHACFLSCFFCLQSKPYKDLLLVNVFSIPVLVLKVWGGYHSSSCVEMIPVKEWIIFRLLDCEFRIRLL